MRTISVVVLALVLLAGCEGGPTGERLSKASNVPLSNGSVDGVAPAQAPAQTSQCWDTCSAKANESQAKCMKSYSAEACNEAKGNALLQCHEKCD